MSKIARFAQRVFGSTANPATQVTKIGSFAAGSVVYSADPTVLQSLTNYLEGWPACIVGANSPTIEDMTALHFVITQQLAYLCQNGVPEWDASTTYYIGSFASDSVAGKLYVSLTDANLGNALTDTNNWVVFKSGALNPQANALLSARAVSLWTNQSASSVKAYSSVCYSPELGIFCAAALDAATANKFMTSSDGVTWASHNSNVSDSNIQVEAICWSSELGLFCAGGIDNGDLKVLTSPDGSTWSRQSIPNQSTISDIIYCRELGMFVATAFLTTPTNGHILYSLDGLTWTHGTTPTSPDVAPLQGVCYSPELNLFVAVASAGTNQVLTSSDGITWTGSLAAEANAWRSVCWASEIGLFVAVSSDGTHRIMTSRDGLTWTAVTAPQASQWHKIVFSSELGVLMMTSLDGTRRLASSRNGVNWTLRTESQSNDWYGLCWSPQKSKFVAVSQSGANRVMTSSYVGKFITP